MQSQYCNSEHLPLYHGFFLKLTFIIRANMSALCPHYEEGLETCVRHHKTIIKQCWTNILGGSTFVSYRVGTSHPKIGSYVIKWSYLFGLQIMSSHIVGAREDSRRRGGCKRSAIGRGHPKACLIQSNIVSHVSLHGMIFDLLVIGSLLKGYYRCFNWKSVPLSGLMMGGPPNECLGTRLQYMATIN